jgi:hypothetical protein
MGLSRTLISMLALDISRYENGSEDSLLQSFHQLNGFAGLREKLGDTIDSPKYIKTIWGVGYKIS